MGKVYKYGDNVDTDVIIPARYLTSDDEAVLKTHCMEDIDSDFAKTVRDGDVVVGGKNFGSGSSREHAPLALKACGVKLVAAKSFARIFFRNAINIGLMVVESEKIADGLSFGNKVEISDGILKNLTTGESFELPKSDGFIEKIIEKGGLMKAVKVHED